MSVARSFKDVSEEKPGKNGEATHHCVFEDTQSTVAGHGSGGHSASAFYPLATFIASSDTASVFSMSSSLCERERNHGCPGWKKTPRLMVSV